MRGIFLTTALAILCLTVPRMANAQDEQAADVLAEDLKLLQGKWELALGNDGTGRPTLYSVKEIVGNRETLRRYDGKTGQKIREHSVDFTLSQSGAVRVFTFYPVGGEAKQGQSFIYKVDAENFYDVAGLLQGDDYRNYQATPAVWRWKRIDPNAPEPRLADPAPPRQEIDPVVRKALEMLGARITAQPAGYSIDIRRQKAFLDAHLDVVADCPQVLDLTLEQVSITDRGLDKLQALPQVRRLILNDCAISGAGLKTLAQLPLRETLISIGLRGTKLKDGDLQWLKDFPLLERVDVSKTAVTDASLPALESLPLKVLTVSETQISAAALEALLNKRPQLVLNR